MVARSRVRSKVEVTTLMMIDSMDMKPGDREFIFEQCLTADEDKIIVTHGTDTVAVTAAGLAGKVEGKTIVLTGAMIPYKFGSSDGFFNLECALAFVQSLPAGVYFVMNGRALLWDNVRMNRVSGVFEEVK